MAIVKRDARLTMCPYACGYRGRADTIENHMHFVCRRRPVKCVRCGVIVKEEVLVEVCARWHHLAPPLVCRTARRSDCNAIFL